MKTSGVPERTRSSCPISPAPWMGSKPRKTGGNQRSLSASLLKVEVELRCDDTTSWHFALDEMAQGQGDDALVEGRMAAGAQP